MQIVLILTATVTPSSPETRIRNPTLRFAAYRSALRFWINLDDSRLNRIVLIENSGANLDQLRLDVSANDNQWFKKVEFISAPHVPIPLGVSYGFGELAMIDYAMERSTLIADCSHFIKATGRVTFPSVSKTLDRLPRDFNLAVDLRRRPPLAIALERAYREKNTSPRRIYALYAEARRRPNAFAASQIMMFSKRFYERWIRREYLNMSPVSNRLIENLIYGQIMKAKETETGMVLRWPCNLEPDGWAGGDGRDYNSKGHALVSNLRGLGRLIAPGFWI